MTGKQALSLNIDGTWTVIYRGQLFYFFQEIIEKEERFRDETRSEGRLYEPVLEKLFKHPIEVRKRPHRQKGLQDYYGVPTQVWKDKLGG